MFSIHQLSNAIVACLFVPHGNISIRLHYMIFWTMQTIYFLKAYHLVMTMVKTETYKKKKTQRHRQIQRPKVFQQKISQTFFSKQIFHLSSHSLNIWISQSFLGLIDCLFQLYILICIRWLYDKLWCWSSLCYSLQPERRDLSQVKQSKVD